MPIGHVASHLDVYVNMARPPSAPPAYPPQQIPVAQLLVPEHSSELPMHAPLAVHELIVREVTQQTCEVESHGVIMHAI
ncbi:MAG: hypothetical protein ACREJ3_09905 [Polyangiaceae bacterium]